jgi:chromatin structure-remodeling complex subunit RSC1/2
MSGTTPSLQRMPSQTMPQTPRLQHQSSQSHLQPQYHGASAQAPAFNQTYASHPASYTPKPNFGPQTPAAQPHPNQYTTPHHSAHQAPQPFAYPPSRTAAPYSQAQGHVPRPTEVFHLSNAANEAIPADVRSQFHQDDQGRVLFFNQPPVDPVPPRTAGLRHTQAYLDAKAIRDKKIAEHKRKLAEEAPIREAEAKKRRLEEEKARKAQEKELFERSLLTLCLQLEKDTEEIYKSRFPDDPNAQLRARLFDCDRKDESITKNLTESKAREEREARKQEAQANGLKDTGKPTVYKDDLDPRIPFN